MFRLVHLGPPAGRGAALDYRQESRNQSESPPSRWTTITARRRWTDSWSVRQIGIKIVNKYSYSLKDRQFGSIVASVKRDNPDAIYATGYFFTGGPLVAQLRAAGIKVPIIGSQAFELREVRRDRWARRRRHYIVDSFDRDRKDAALQKFFSEFKNRAGYSPEGVAAADLLGGQADGGRIKRANSADPAKVRDALAATKDFPMLEGKLAAFNIGA